MGTVRVLLFVRNGWIVRVASDIGIIACKDLFPRGLIRIRLRKPNKQLMIKAASAILNYIDNSQSGEFPSFKDSVIDMDEAKFFSEWCID